MGASYNKYFELKKKYGLTDSFVARSAEIPKSTFTDWKNGRSSPKIDKLQRIAMLFGVTVDYFLYDDMNTSDDSVQTSAVTPHYDDERTEQITRKLHDNPELAAIFDAYSDLAPEDAKLISDMIMRMSDGKRKGL